MPPAAIPADAAVRGTPVRLGLVGCGRLAELGYAPAALRAAGVEITAVADPDRARRNLVASRLGAFGHAQASEMLSAGQLDGVIVCTASERHEEIATLVAGAGLPALVEKPPAPDAAGALRLAALTPAPWIGFNRRFDQGVAFAGRIPPDGELDLHMLLHYRRTSWRPVGGGDDALLDLAPHLIDLALYLTRASPLAVRAQATRERAGIELAMSRGRVRIECATDRPHRELVEIRKAGAQHVLRVQRGGHVRGLAARVLPGSHPLVASLTRQLEAFGRALRGADPGPLATAAEGAATMRVLDAARQSDDIGETVQIEGVMVGA